jgi:hypothetical protein
MRSAVLGPPPSMTSAVDDRASAARLADANAPFSIWQRIAGPFDVGLTAALFAAQTHRHGPVAALHLTATVLTLFAAVAALARLAACRQAEEGLSLVLAGDR